MIFQSSVTEVLRSSVDTVDIRGERVKSWLRLYRCVLETRTSTKTNNRDLDSSSIMFRTLVVAVLTTSLTQAVFQCPDAKSSEQNCIVQEPIANAEATDDRYR